jgi:pimeloyl-ACP methyl ester carboxylesterase
MYGARLKKLAGGVFALYLLVLAWTALLPVSSFAGDKPDTSHPHKQPARLLVTGGQVAAGGPGLSGSFLVQNVGGQRSGRFSASVVIAAPGGNVVAKNFAMAPLGAGARRTVKVSSPLPGGLPAQAMPIRACVAKPAKKGKRPKPRCRAVGTLKSTTAPAPPAPSTSSVPTAPIPFDKGVVFILTDPESNYWIYVPTSYDSSHQTATPLLVWLHGCGGESSGDINTVSPGLDGAAQDWISIAVGGKEGGCWDPGGDQSKVAAAIADLKTHFNVDPHRVILGGYSSGGDLAYRLAFYNSGSFAGVLAENTSPFRDTGSSQGDSLAATTTKFNVVHLAHIQDGTYPIAEVRAETDAMKAAGFPITRIEADGTHYDEPGAIVNGHPVAGTDADLRALLLPHIDDDWRSP